MNILFVLRGLTTGGLEVVTKFLTEKFQSEGHHVYIYSFTEGEPSIADRLDKNIPVFVQKEYKVTKENIQALRNVLVDNHINIIINQWGLPLIPIKVIKKASKDLKIKIVAVYHNNPSFNGRIQNVQIAIDSTQNPIKKFLLEIKKKIFTEITSYGMRYNYRNTDKYMVLSSSFVEEFKRFSHIKHPKHLLVQTNPITVDYSAYTYSQKSKQKKIIYVGRLDYIQKRVDRVIDTWALLENRYPDWRLTLIGVGEEQESLQEQVKRLGLKRVSFEGYKQPRPYYERASILLLTSDFEGFPLVLAECMSFGVVPVVYASYPAVTDIIQDKVNGEIVEPINGQFVTVNMAKAVEYVLRNDAKRDIMAQNAIETAMKGYSIDAIYSQWMQVFKNL
jgi:glycosyltransferase involved in cell wall biosynthesis